MTSDVETCKTTGFEPAQDSFKIREFFSKNYTLFFCKVRDGCRSLLINASEVSYKCYLKRGTRTFAENCENFNKFERQPRAISLFQDGRHAGIGSKIGLIGSSLK